MRSRIGLTPIHRRPEVSAQFFGSLGSTTHGAERHITADHDLARVMSATSTVKFQRMSVARVRTLIAWECLDQLPDRACCVAVPLQ
jgi:uncharacterized protein (DUF2249 family)